MVFFLEIFGLIIIVADHKMKKSFGSLTSLSLFVKMYVDPSVICELCEETCPFDVFSRELTRNGCDGFKSF